MSDQLMIAIVAAGGVVAGAVTQTLGQIALARFGEYQVRRRNEPRRKLLRQMLDNPKWEWRELDTLQHVIGCDAETTKQLLLEVDARASESG